MVFLGLSPILESEYAMILVGFVGGAALALMGLKLVMDATRLKMDNASTINISLNSAGRPLYMLVALGFLSSCSNPYVFIWWLATGFPMITSFISLAGLPGFLSFLVGHAAADLSWFSFVSYSVCKGRRIMNKVIIQVILFASAIFLIIFAAYLIVLAWIRMS
jgi:threonine/homoserine/homoserine lactone efflux protein